VDKVVTTFGEFDGSIVLSPKYDPPNSIRMSTGIRDFPFRVIQKNRIKSINGKKSVFVEQVESFKLVKGSRGDTYKVTMLNGAGYSCTCPGFQFKKHCKHLGA